MSGFLLPVKDIIVNDDTQIIMREDDGTTYLTGDMTATTGGFILEGFHSDIVWAAAAAAGAQGTYLNLLGAALRVIKDTPSAGAKEVKSYVLTSTTNVANAVFRIVATSLDLTPAEYQNNPVEKRYQIPATATVDLMGAAIVAAVNGDKYAKVVAAYNAGTDTLTLTAKDFGISFNLYSEEFTVPTATGVTLATLPINTYDYLNNINWSKNLDIDRNLAWQPIKGTTYNSYYFETLAKSVTNLGDVQVPGELHSQSLQAFKLWVKPGTTLDTALTAMAANVNV